MKSRALWILGLVAVIAALSGGAAWALDDGRHAPKGKPPVAGQPGAKPATGRGDSAFVGTPQPPVRMG